MLVNAFSYCQEKRSENEIQIFILQHTGVEISKFELVKKETNSIINDYTESILLQFDSLHFDNIINQVVSISYNQNTNVTNAQSQDTMIDMKWLKYRSG